MLKTFIISKKLFIMLHIFFLFFRCLEAKATYSHNEYYTSSLIKYSHFYQLPSLDIIGISENSKITFKNIKGTYKYISNDNTSNFLSFKSTVLSKDELYLENNSIILIPCPEVNGTIYELAKIDLLNQTVIYTKSQRFTMDKNQVHQCGIIQQPSENLYTVTLISQPNAEFNTTYTYCVILNLNATNISSQHGYAFAYCQNYKKGQHNCVYAEFRSGYFCFYFDEYKQHSILLYSFINTKYIKEGVINKGFYANTYLYLTNLMNKIQSFTLEKINDKNGLILVYYDDIYFYTFFYEIKADTNELNFRTDMKKRKGTSSGTKSLRINKDYFIICSSAENILYLYLFNVNLRAQINSDKNEIFSSYSNLILNYLNNSLILINQVQGSSLDLFEFNLIKCKSNASILLHPNINDFLINFNLLYESSGNETLNEYTDISVSFFSISLPNEISVYGESQIEANLNPVIVGYDHFYTNIQITHNLSTPTTVPFKYILQRNFRGLKIPSFLCNGQIQMKCFSNCKTCSEVGNEENHHCLECNDNYYMIYQYHNNNYSNSENESFNCYNNLTGYFLDDDLMFKKCFELCDECFNSGNQETNNCSKCIEGYTLLSDFTGNQMDSNCVKKCDLEYFSWYIDYNGKFICNYDNTCPEFAVLNYTTKECIIQSEILFNKNRNSHIIKEKGNDNIKEILNLLSEDPLLFFNPLQEKIVFDNFTISFFDNINNSVINIPKECIEKINIKYNDIKENGNNISIIANNQSYYLALLEILSKDVYPTNQIDYSIFTKNGTLVNLLETCKNSEIKIKQGINQESKINMFNAYLLFANKEVNVFNASESFFNDYCEGYNTKEKDVPVMLRRELYFQNESLCDNNCNVSSIIDNTVIECSCKPKEKMDYDLNDRNENKKKNNFITQSVSNSAMKYMKCGKNLINSKTLSNTGFLVTVPLCAIATISIILAIRILFKPKMIFEISQPGQPPKKKERKEKLTKTNVAKGERKVNFSENNLIYVNNVNNNNISNNQSNQLILYQNNPETKKSKFNIEKSQISNQKLSEINNANGNIITKVKVKKEDKIKNNFLSKMKEDMKQKKFGDILTKKLIILSPCNDAKIEPLEKLNRIIILITLYLFIFFITSLFYTDDLQEKSFKNEEEKKYVLLEPKIILISFISAILFSLIINVYIYITQKFNKVVSIISLLALLVVDILIVFDISTFCSVNVSGSINVGLCSILIICMDFGLDFFLVYFIYLIKKIGVKYNFGWLLIFCEVLFYL